MVLMWVIIFIISLAVLVKASDFFTTSAEKIGLHFKIPPFIIGVTIVALGTSLPELISSIYAVFNGASEIVVGNVIGSNITNIFLVLGIAAIVAKKMKISFELIHVDLPLLIGSALFLTLALLDKVFSMGEAILSIIGIIIYLIYTTKIQKGHTTKKTKKEVKSLEKFQWHTVVILIASALFIFIGAKYTVESVINISEILNIGKEIIAITAVALGTSLPELVVSITAARKGKAEIAVGNVLGSNIFNTFAVMGIPALFGNLTIPNSILTFGLPVMIVATLLYLFITQDKEITRWEGSLLLLFYVFFVGKTFGLL